MKSDKFKYTFLCRLPRRRTKLNIYFLIAGGRYARLCVQVDVDKPLVTAVLIGKFEQPVCYEGIQKLCFSCGRMGYWRESCPYMVRPDLTSREVETEDVRDVGARSCDKHVPIKPNAGEGPSKIVHGHEKAHEGTYGPWIVVAWRRNVTKNQQSGGAHTMLDNGWLRQE